jgi:hypothetical protein
MTIATCFVETLELERNTPSGLVLSLWMKTRDHMIVRRREHQSYQTQQIDNHSTNMLVVITPLREHR